MIKVTLKMIIYQEMFFNIFRVFTNDLEPRMAVSNFNSTKFLFLNMWGNTNWKLGFSHLFRSTSLLFHCLFCDQINVELSIGLSSSQINTISDIFFFWTCVLWYHCAEILYLNNCMIYNLNHGMVCLPLSSATCKQCLESTHYATRLSFWPFKKLYSN